MGDRSRQIASEWLAKCVDVVLDARDAPREDGRGAVGGKMNRWFNCAGARRRETTEALAGDRGGGGDGFDGVDEGGAFVGRFLVVDVAFEGDGRGAGEGSAGGGETSASTLVERWAFHAGADAGAVGGNNHFNKELETPVVYKRAVIMVRTLVALIRTLPAHGARLRAMRRYAAARGRDAGGGRFTYEIRELASGTTIADAHPGKQAGYRTFAFADVPTSVGKLSACVYFLDEPAVKALEEKFVGCVDATPVRSTPRKRLDASVGPDVELAGGEMSLSPSPTGKGNDARAARETDLREVSRGLIFGDGDAPEALTRRGSVAAPPLQPLRGIMPSSSSAGSLQQLTKPPAVPMADYTSPNYQRFDSAPCSAPSSGPAPIYGFNAAPADNKAPRASASAIDAPEIASGPQRPPRRATLESCLKIDVGTSMERDDVGASDQAPTTPSPPTTSTITAVFASDARTPESKRSPTILDSTPPIACSPASLRAATTSRAVGMPSPSWGGFACPESPSPSLGTSPGGTYLAARASSRRSSWSPSSSLGTSLRDIVGVYPHSPGGSAAAAAAFARRMSGASDEIGMSPHANDEDDFPFALDDAAPSATYVEHTPADLLSLLENPLPLRRRSTDGPLPLDAALDDEKSIDASGNQSASSDKGASTKSIADVSSALRGVTLGSALDALRELDAVAADLLASESPPCA